MMRIKEFRFLWTNAWRSIIHGYDITVEHTSENTDALLAIVNLEPFKIQIDEDTFISDLLSLPLSEWNQKTFFNPNVLDGTSWSLSFTYDDYRVEAAGINGFPKEFPRFLHILHMKYHVPTAKCFNRKTMNRYIRDTIVEETDFAWLTAHIEEISLSNQEMPW